MDKDEWSQVQKVHYARHEIQNRCDTRSRVCIQ